MVNELIQERAVLRSGLLAMLVVVSAACGASSTPTASTTTTVAATTATTAAPASWCTGLRAYRQLQLDAQTGKASYGTISAVAHNISAQWAAASTVSSDDHYDIASREAQRLSEITGTGAAGLAPKAMLTAQLVSEFRAINNDIATLPSC